VPRSRRAPIRYSPIANNPRWLFSFLNQIKPQWRSCGGTPQGVCARTLSVHTAAVALAGTAMTARHAPHRNIERAIDIDAIAGTPDGGLITRPGFLEPPRASSRWQTGITCPLSMPSEAAMAPRSLAAIARRADPAGHLHAKRVRIAKWSGR
jgi:hypothetical protein